MKKEKNKKREYLSEKQIKEVHVTIEEKIEQAKKDFEKIFSNEKNLSKKEREELYAKKTEEIKEEVIEKLEKQAEKQSKFTILGYNVWTLMAYFVIYSFLGFLLETTYGLLTKGVIESRKSFLYGPFCGIYGLGAVVMILLLQYFKKNNFTVFMAGYFIGSAIEYVVSLVGEKMLHVKWWDYSNEPFNIGGRVCLFYSLAWGILAIWLIRKINPAVDNFIEEMKIKLKLPRLALPILFNVATGFLIFDCIISGIAMNVFYSRLVHDYNLNIPNAAMYELSYERTAKNEKWKNFTDKHFSNEKMLRTYPNLKMQDVDGNIIFVKDILSDIKPYYLKVYTPRNKVVRFTNVETVTYDEK